MTVNQLMGNVTRTLGYASQYTPSTNRFMRQLGRLFDARAQDEPSATIPKWVVSTASLQPDAGRRQRRRPAMGLGERVQCGWIQSISCPGGGEDSRIHKRSAGWRARSRDAIALSDKQGNFA